MAILNNGQYLKIERFSGNKQMLVQLVHLSKKDGVILDYSQYEFTPDTESKSYHKQAYEYLLTLPEFSEAESC
ncbi:hypothetical protein L3X65_02535 [Vibrio diabolicus]|uniref:hypothetical protein n=1 Tax=Vibrio diabolicus TaxID=50719 RepID=UPI00211ACEB3|nr:hypothetical protein [Vibrio diabolicus]MCG9228047.1 hypothetical protein [Vibrio diabolicus]MCG9569939.1 hypothetical protein [Vibrio diabolicus]MCG9594345.1 hypothetical protein [Vibrio diabolicus]